MKPLDHQDLQEALNTLPGWKLVDDKLYKKLVFKDFVAALGYMVKVGLVAEKMDHHPDWTNVYNRLEVFLNTHAAGGRITAADVDLAHQMEALL